MNIKVIISFSIIRTIKRYRWLWGRRCCICCICDALLYARSISRLPYEKTFIHIQTVVKEKHCLKKTEYPKERDICLPRIQTTNIHTTTQPLQSHTQLSSNLLTINWSRGQLILRLNVIKSWSSLDYGYVAVLKRQCHILVDCKIKFQLGTSSLKIRRFPVESLNLIPMVQRCLIE